MCACLADYGSEVVVVEGRGDGEILLSQWRKFEGCSEERKVEGLIWFDSVFTGVRDNCFEQ